MEKNEQRYCVVAQRRDMGYNRVMITGGMTKDSAYRMSTSFQKSSTYKKMYKYFKVAKYPFKEIK